MEALCFNGRVWNKASFAVGAKPCFTIFTAAWTLLGERRSCDCLSSCGKEKNVNKQLSKSVRRAKNDDVGKKKC